MAGFGKFSPLRVKTLKGKATFTDIFIEGMFEIQRGRGLNWLVWATIQAILLISLPGGAGALAKIGIDNIKDASQIAVPTPVKSSWISAIQWIPVDAILDPAKKNAKIDGRSFRGSIGIYFKRRKPIITPPWHSKGTFNRFMASKSKGRFYLDNIAFSRGGRKLTSAGLGVDNSRIDPNKVWHNLVSKAGTQTHIFEKLKLTKEIQKLSNDPKNLQKIKDLQEASQRRIRMTRSIARGQKFARRASRIAKNPDKFVKQEALRQASRRNPGFRKARRVKSLALNPSKFAKRKVRRKAKTKTKLRARKRFGIKSKF